MGSLTDRFRDQAMRGERLGWRLAARFVFVGIVIALVAVIMLSDSFLFAIASATLLGLFLRAVLPTEKIQQWARSYWNGEAGDRWRQRAHDAWDRLTFWR